MELCGKRHIPHHNVARPAAASGSLWDSLKSRKGNGSTAGSLWAALGFAKDPAAVACLWAAGGAAWIPVADGSLWAAGGPGVTKTVTPRRQWQPAGTGPHEETLRHCAVKPAAATASGTLTPRGIVWNRCQFQIIPLLVE